MAKELCMLARSISIHASNKGGDMSYFAIAKRSSNFNPRLQQRRRRCIVCTSVNTDLFQSTPPTKEATFIRQQPEVENGISIHASNKGGDVQPL